MTAKAKTFWGLFRRNITRLTTVIAIVAVSIGFMAGIGEVEQKIKTGAAYEYTAKNISDFHLKSSADYGFTAEQLHALSARYGESGISKWMAYELQSESGITRVYAGDLSEKINRLTVVEGRLPTAPNEIAVHANMGKIRGVALGQTVSLGENEYTVSGLIKSPMHTYKKDEPSWQFDGKHLTQIVYMHAPALPTCTDVYLLKENRDTRAFSLRYEKEIEEERTHLHRVLGETVTVLSLYENLGIGSMVAYAEKVGVIAIIFVVFFLLVTLLVVFSTTSRLMTEERGRIACFKTLGYGDGQILWKYVAFVLFGTLIGGGIAFALGYGLTSVIYHAFHMQYAMPPFPKGARFFYYLVTLLLIVGTTTILTYLTGKKMVKEKPAALMTPRAPKAGKKVLLERVPVIWNRLAFRYKSSFRNVFLFKSRFFMTVLAVVGATVLVFAGMALIDCASLREDATSMLAISAILLVFSAILCALVIYNLTNINVAERSREIATLMVLGYTEHEVAWYIYREIYIMSAISAVFGLPCGLGFVDLVFGMISFGTISQITWKTWVLTPVLTMVFSVISSLLLRKKIVKTDMNASLKTLE